MAAALSLSEYFVITSDAAGLALGVAGSRERPLGIDILARRRVPGWVWGIVGGVAVAGVAAAATGAALTQRPDPNRPAVVTVQVF